MSEATGKPHQATGNRTANEGCGLPVPCCLLPLCALLFVLGASLVLCSSLAADDAIPLRRVLVDPSRVPAELKKEGEFISLPRAEFEETLTKAERAVAAGKNPPRLLEARYRATLEEGRLIGSAEWKIANPNPVGGMLHLEPWNLALRPQATLNQQPAVVALLGGKPALLVSGSGVQTFALDRKSVV